MEKVGMFDAKTHFSELVDRVVREGRGITVTRRGEPVVDIIPSSARSKSGMTRDEAVAEIMNLRRETSKMSRNEILELIAEGRR